MNDGKAKVLERNMGVLKEMLMTLPHFQGCTREMERENEQLRERSAILMRENRIQLEKIGSLEQSSMALKQENEILRIKLAQNEALINRLRANEGSEDAMRQLLNEAKSYKARAAETDRSRRELKRMKSINMKMTYILKESLHLKSFNDALNYIKNFGFSRSKPEKSTDSLLSSEEEEEDEADGGREEEGPPPVKRMKMGMMDIQNYIKISISVKGPEEIAEHIVGNEAQLRDVTVALSVLLTDNVVPPSVVEMELDVVSGNGDTVSLQSDATSTLIDIIRIIASRKGYAELPDLIIGDLAGRLITTPSSSDARIATYAHSLAALCRGTERPGVVRAACYELLLGYAARGLEQPHVVAALLSAWPTPFAGLSSFPLPGVWVLAGIAAVARDVVSGRSPLLWEKIRKACVWDADVSVKAVAELLAACDATERALSGNNENGDCAEQWILCSELMKTHFGKAEWIQALRDAEASRGRSDAPHTSALLNEYITNLN